MVKLRDTNADAPKPEKAERLSSLVEQLKSFIGFGILKINLSEVLIRGEGLRHLFDRDAICIHRRIVASGLSIGQTQPGIDCSRGLGQSGRLGEDLQRFVWLFGPEESESEEKFGSRWLAMKITGQAKPRE